MSDTPRTDKFSLQIPAVAFRAHDCLTFARTLERELSRLTKELQEAKRDSVRLDEYQVMMRDMNPKLPDFDHIDNCWFIPCLVSNAGGFGGGVGRRTYKNLRTAIDAAREKEGQGL